MSRRAALMRSKAAWEEPLLEESCADSVGERDDVDSPFSRSPSACSSRYHEAWRSTACDERETLAQLLGAPSASTGAGMSLFGWQESWRGLCAPSTLCRTEVMLKLENSTLAQFGAVADALGCGLCEMLAGQRPHLSLACHTRVGCVVLTMDGITSEDVTARGARACAEALLSSQTPAVTEFLHGRRFSLRLRNSRGETETVHYDKGGMLSSGPGGQAVPDLLFVRPFAILSSQPALVTFATSATSPAATVNIVAHARFHSTSLGCSPLALRAGRAPGELQCELEQQLLGEGCLMWSLDRIVSAKEPGERDPLPTLSTPTLFSADQGLVEEINASLEAAIARAEASGGPAARAQAERAAQLALSTLGAALRPNAHPELVHAAARLSLSCGWTHTARLLVDEALAGAALRARPSWRELGLQLRKALAPRMPPSVSRILSALLLRTPLRIAAHNAYHVYVALLGLTIVACLYIAYVVPVAVPGTPSFIGMPLLAVLIVILSAADVFTPVFRGAPDLTEGRPSWLPEPPAASELDYLSWLSRSRTSAVRCIAVFHLLNLSALLALQIRAYPSADAAWSRFQHSPVGFLLASTRIFDADSGLEVNIRDVPWAQIQSGAAWLLGVSALLRLPTNIALLALSPAPDSASATRRFYERHFEVLFVVASLVDTLITPAAEYLFLYRGAPGGRRLVVAHSWLPSYAFTGCLVLSLLLFKGCMGPCRADTNTFLLLSRLAIAAGGLPLSPKLWAQALVPHLVMLAAVVVVVCISVIPAADRRLRAQCALELAAARLMHETP